MPISTRKPSAYERAGLAEINAMVARVAPDVLELLADGVPRSKPAIVEALAGKHDRQDLVHTLVRLSRHRAGGGERRQVRAGAGVGAGRGLSRPRHAALRPDHPHPRQPRHVLRGSSAARQVRSSASLSACSSTTMRRSSPALHDLRHPPLPAARP